jgi:hypothetical protein
MRYIFFRGNRLWWSYPKPGSAPRCRHIGLDVSIPVVANSFVTGAKTGPRLLFLCKKFVKSALCTWLVHLSGDTLNPLWIHKFLPGNRIRAGDPWKTNVLTTDDRWRNPWPVHLRV